MASPLRVQAIILSIVLAMGSLAFAGEAEDLMAKATQKLSRGVGKVVIHESGERTKMNDPNMYAHNPAEIEYPVVVNPEAILNNKQGRILMYESGARVFVPNDFTEDTVDLTDAKFWQGTLHESSTPNANSLPPASGKSNAQSSAIHHSAGSSDDNNR